MCSQGSVEKREASAELGNACQSDTTVLLSEESCCSCPQLLLLLSLVAAAAALFLAAMKARNDSNMGKCFQNRQFILVRICASDDHLQKNDL